MKLWTADNQSGSNEDFNRLNNSLVVDKRLAVEDIQGSIAWAAALKSASVLSIDEYSAIEQGLNILLAEFNAGTFTFLESDEDIHTAVERRLTELIGSTAGKLHTGRSRNDQVATDFRLWMMTAVPEMIHLIRDFQTTLIQRAEQDLGIILPGYTHLQQAQPVLISHWWLSHFWALERDTQNFLELLKETAVMPLGSGALAGSTVQVNRHLLAEEMGFKAPSPNSLDAVSDRDFAAKFLFYASLMFIHLSRLAEQLIIFNSQEFGFINLADEFATGSSLMPQKKNPDLFEIIRGKSGTVLGHLMGMMATIKALPSAYDKDLQEDKEHVFIVFDILAGGLKAIKGAVTTLVINSGEIHKKMDWRMLATDLADYLVKKGVPFREAHHLAADAVRLADSLGTLLPDMEFQHWQSITIHFESDLYQVFNFEKSVEKHDVFGGTARRRVEEQLELAKQHVEK